MRVVCRACHSPPPHSASAINTSPISHHNHPTHKPPRAHTHHTITQSHTHAALSPCAQIDAVRRAGDEARRGVEAARAMVGQAQREMQRAKASAEWVMGAPLPPPPRAGGGRERGRSLVEGKGEGGKRTGGGWVHVCACVVMCACGCGQDRKGVGNWVWCGWLPWSSWSAAASTALPLPPTFPSLNPSRLTHPCSPHTHTPLPSSHLLSPPPLPCSLLPPPHTPSEAKQVAERDAPQTPDSVAAWAQLPHTLEELEDLRLAKVGRGGGGGAVL